MARAGPAKQHSPMSRERTQAEKQTFRGPRLLWTGGRLVRGAGQEKEAPRNVKRVQEAL